ncbi:MAG: AraC family transcriptional regulator [Planctomycetota bacterium]
MPNDALLAWASFSCDLVKQVRVVGPWMPVAHAADCDKLYVVTKGAGWLTIDHRRYRLGPGRVFMIPAGCVHAGESDADDPLEKTYVHFHSRTAEQLPVLRLSPPPLAVTGASAKRVAQWVEEMRVEWDARRAARALALNVLLGRVILQLYRTPPRQRLAGRPDPQAGLGHASDEHYDVIRVVLSRITRDYAQPLSLPTLAEEVCWTPGHLSRVFARIVGQPPRRFLESVRMQQARYQLAGTDYSVADVARRVGYADANYFSRAFSRAFGVSPRRYRESLYAGLGGGG